MKANFHPKHQAMLDEFAAGMREHKAKKAALAKHRGMHRPYAGLLAGYGLDRRYPAFIGNTDLRRNAT